MKLPVYSLTGSEVFRSTGMPYDTGTSLYLFGARFYDPSLGRFVAEDSYNGTKENPLSQNRYAYAEDNPMKFRDPSGHMIYAGDIGGYPTISTYTVTATAVTTTFTTCTTSTSSTTCTITSIITMSVTVILNLGGITYTETGSAITSTTTTSNTATTNTTPQTITTTATATGQCIALGYMPTGIPPLGVDGIPLGVGLPPIISVPITVWGVISWAGGQIGINIPDPFSPSYTSPSCDNTPNTVYFVFYWG